VLCVLPLFLGIATRREAQTNGVYFLPRKGNDMGKLDENTIKSVWNKSKGKCWYCGRAITIESRMIPPHPEMYVIDHALPSSLGGGDNIENLVPSCWTCNASKRNKTVEQFRIYRARKVAGMPKFDDDQIGYLAYHGIFLPEIPPFYFYFEKEGLENNG